MMPRSQNKQTNTPLKTAKTKRKGGDPTLGAVDPGTGCPATCPWSGPGLRRIDLGGLGQLEAHGSPWGSTVEASKLEYDSPLTLEPREEGSPGKSS